MSLRKKGLVLAMEDDSEVVPGAGELSDSVAEVAESVAEIDDSVTEIDDLNGDIDSAEADLGTLDKIQDVMEESVEKGEGLDETSAEIAEIAIESICARLGIEKRVMPAMESFGSSNSRIVATKIAMEGVKEIAERVWKAIKEAFQKVWAYIVEFYKKYLTGLGRAKEANTALLKEAKSFGKTEVEKDKIENSSLASALYAGGKADAGSVKVILANHVKLTEAANNGLSVLSDVSKMLYAGPEKIDLDKLGKAAEDFVGAGIDFDDSLVGQTSLNAEVTKATEGARGFMVRVISKSKAVEQESLPVLSKAEMEAVCEGVDEVLKATTKFIENKNKLEATIKNFFKGIDLIIKAMSDLAKDGENNSDIEKTNSAVKESVSNARSSISALSSFVPAANLRAANESMKYVKASMKAYK